MRGGSRTGSGRKKGAHSQIRQAVIEKAQDAALEAIDVLIEIMNSASCSEKTRVQAATAILDRAIGKPLTATNDDTNKDETTHLTVKLVKADGDGNAQ